MSERAATSPIVFLIGSACIGAGLGLLAYRFGMLPFGWRSSMSFLFPGLAAGLAMGGLRLVRSREGRPAIAVLALSAFAGAGAAFGIAFAIVPPLGHASLTARAFPGFSLQLPSGEIAKEQLDYHAGKVMMKNVAGMGGVIGIAWEGEQSSREQLELAGKALASSVGATTAPRLVTIAGPGGQPVDTVVIESDKGPMWISALTCGRRGIVVQSMGASGMVDLHRKIVTTFECRPDPAQELAAIDGVVPVAVELAGWYATERAPNHVTLSDGQAVLMLTKGTFTAAALPAVVPAIFEGTAQLEIGEPIGDRRRIRGTLDTGPIVGWVRLLDCSAFSVMVLAFADDEATADRVAALVAGARCLGAGESAPHWPDPPGGAVPE